MAVEALAPPDAARVAIRIATRVATVYTNAPKRPREAISTDLCTLLRCRPGGDAHVAGAVTQPPAHTSSRTSQSGDRPSSRGGTSGFPSCRDPAGALRPGRRSRMRVRAHERASRADDGPHAASMARVKSLDASWWMSCPDSTTTVLQSGIAAWTRSASSSVFAA